MRETQTTADTKETEQGWSSTLTKGRERFLAHVIEQGLEIGRRTPEDFLRHFPPMAIMEALREQPKLRAAIIAFTTGTKQRVALKKRWESCGEDVQIALEEGETDAQSVLALFDLDDRVRYLDPKKLWSYMTEGEFWKVTASRHRELDMARLHIAFMIERALEDKLLTHQDIVDGITVDELAARLPKSELGNIIKQSLANSRADTPFTERDLLTAVPPSVLVNYVPLVHVWNTVIVKKIAERHGYADAEAAKSRPSESPANDVEPQASAGGESAKAAGGGEASISSKPQGELPAMPAPPPGASASKAPPKNKAAAQNGNGAQSEVGFKVPGPGTKEKTGKGTIDTSTWSAEVGEGDLVEDDTMADDDFVVEVVNS